MVDVLQSDSIKSLGFVSKWSIKRADFDKSVKLRVNQRRGGNCFPGDGWTGGTEMG